jgi:hypothetical protein
MSQYLQILQQVIFWVLALYETLLLPLCPFLLRDAFEEVGKGDAGWSERIYTFGLIFRKRANCARLQENGKFKTVLVIAEIWRALFLIFFINYGLFALYKSLNF